MNSRLAVSRPLSWPALLALAVVLPFELVRPLVVAGPLVFTNVELMAAAVGVLWVLDGLRLRRRPVWPAWFWPPLVAWMAVLLLSAVLAPVARVEAFKFSLRSLAGVVMALIVCDQVAADARRVRPLAFSLAAGATLAAVLGCLEVFWPAALLPALDGFKLQTTRVAGVIRASGPFGYANIAAQYWEAGLVLLLTWATGAPRRWHLAAALAAGVVLAEGLVLTASRAGLAALAAALLVLLALQTGLPRRERPATVARPLVLWGALAGTALAVLVLLAGTQLLLSPVQQARLRREVETGIQRARYEAPAVLTMTAGETRRVRVTVTNDGELPWKAQGAEPVLLSYHWLDAAAETILWFEGDRTALPTDMPPGAVQVLHAFVRAPAAPGSYVLAWDLLQSQVAWFSMRGVALGRTEVVVVAAARPAPTPAATPPAPMALTTLTRAQGNAPVARQVLWGAGWQMWLQHPLLGVGPDNFRRVWGDVLHLSGWRDDGRGSVLHSNSLYVEILSTLGLAGVVVFGWLLLVLARAGLVAFRTGRPAQVTWVAGLGAVLCTFLFHGVFDYFLEFTATYLLWWMVVGAFAGLTHAVIEP